MKLKMLSARPCRLCSSTRFLMYMLSHMRVRPPRARVGDAQNCPAAFVAPGPSWLGGCRCDFPVLLHHQQIELALFHYYSYYFGKIIAIIAKKASGSLIHIIFLLFDFYLLLMTNIYYNISILVLHYFFPQYFYLLFMLLFPFMDGKCAVLFTIIYYFILQKPILCEPAHKC
jgi:hypothetical protein